MRGGFDPNSTLRLRGDPLNPATRGVPRVPPHRLAAPLHSDFLRGGGGGFYKLLRGKGEGRLPLLKTEYTELVYSTTDYSVVVSICRKNIYPSTKN